MDMFRKLKRYFENYKQLSGNARYFLACTFTLGLCNSMFELLFNLYLKERGYSEGQIGHVISMDSLGMAIMAIPAALLISKIDIKKIFVVSIFAASLFHALQVFIDDINYILFIRFIGSIFSTVYAVAAAPFAMKNSTSKERIYLFSLLASANIFAQSIGFLVAGYLPQFFKMFMELSSKDVSFQTSLYLSSFLYLLVLIPLRKITSLPLYSQKDRQDLLIAGQSNNITELNPLFSSKKYYVRLGQLKKFYEKYNMKKVLKLIFPKSILAMGAGLIIPFIPLYFKTVFKFEENEIGIVYSFLQMFIFTGMLLAPLLEKKFTAIKAIVYTQLLSIPFMFILAITTSSTVVICSFFIRGMLMNMITPIIGKFEMEMVNDFERPVTNALVAVFWNLAWTVGTYCGGMIIEKFSFSCSFYISIVLYAIAASSYYVIFRETNFLPNKVSSEK
ncbi:MAG: MFS transporter [Oligoflexia bacterium]|nr:MFS transporter [Oligoflexia bacterium]